MTDTPLPTTGHNRLTALACEIREADDRCRRAAEEAAAAAIEAGHKLIEAKALVAHGGWLPWLKEHVAMSERSANRYMVIARARLEIRHVADLGIRAAADFAAIKPPGENEILRWHRETDGPGEGIHCWASDKPEWFHLIKLRDDIQADKRPFNWYLIMLNVLHWGFARTPVQRHPCDESDIVFLKELREFALGRTDDIPA